MVTQQFWITRYMYTNFSGKHQRGPETPRVSTLRQHTWDIISCNELMLSLNNEICSPSLSTLNSLIPSRFFFQNPIWARTRKLNFQYYLDSVHISWRSQSKRPICIISYRGQLVESCTLSTAVRNKSFIYYIFSARSLSLMSAQHIIEGTLSFVGIPHIFLNLFL